MTDDVVLRNEADLLAARPIIASAVSGIVAGGAFGSLFRRAVVDAHRAIFDRDRDTLTLTLADVGTVVAAALEKVDPRLAADLDAGNRVVLLKRSVGSVTGDVVRIGDRLRILAYVLAALTLAAAGAALAVSPRSPAHRLAARARHGRRRRGDGRRLHRRESRRRGPPERPGQPRRRRPECGTRSSATCAPSAGCWPARAP